MIDLIHLKKNRLHHIVAYELEVRVTEMMHHVLFTPREEVIHDDHRVSSLHQPIHQMRPHEPRAAGDHDSQPLAFQSERDFPAR
ncbi:unnamed protein product [Brassica oleracea var. botrytis]